MHEGSLSPNTACSANLRGPGDETTSHHSSCTGTGLTGPHRYYSEAICNNLLVSRQPLVTVAQPWHDMAWDLDSNTRWHVVLLMWACCDNLHIDFFGLCIILRRMLLVTSGVQTEGGLCFGGLATEPVVRHFLTNARMALFAGRPLPGNLLQKILQVSYIYVVPHC
jgi:hypothetical protein